MGEEALEEGAVPKGISQKVILREYTAQPFL